MKLLAPRPGAHPGPGKNAARKAIRALAGLAAALALLLAVRLWILEPYRVVSPSMEPALRCPAGGNSPDTIVVNRLSYLFSDPGRWEVVVFRAVDEPDGGATPLVKRVAGLPGETIEIDGGEILIDGRRLERPEHLSAIRYVRNGAYGRSPVKLGPDEYFLLGDNSAPSVDSRRFGPVTRAHIIGRAVWILWPWERAGAIR